MPEFAEMEVMFRKYCAKCVHKKLDEKMDPCNECLSQPYNFNTEKPIHYEEAESK